MRHLFTSCLSGLLLAAQSPLVGPGLVDDDGRPCTNVLVRVNLPNALAHGVEPDVRLAAIDLEMDLTYSQRIEQRLLPVTDGALEAVLTVPVDGRVGFAAYSELRGYKEVAVPARSWEQGHRVPRRTADVPVVDLELPDVSMNSTLSITPDAGLMSDPFVHGSYSVELPVTRWEVAREALRPKDFEGGRVVNFLVPAGDYIVEGDTYFIGCGNGSARPALATGLLKKVQLRGGEPVEIRHVLQEGVSLTMQIDVDGAPTAALPFLEPPPNQFRHFWWADPLRDPLDRWYATATIERIDNEDPSTVEPPHAEILDDPATEVTWGWYTQVSAVDHLRVPLGILVYTTQIYRPGRYRFHFKGPLIEATSVEVTVESSGLTLEERGARVRRRIRVPAAQ